MIIVFCVFHFHARTRSREARLAKYSAAHAKRAAAIAADKEREAAEWRESRERYERDKPKRAHEYKVAVDYLCEIGKKAYEREQEYKNESMRRQWSQWMEEDRGALVIECGTAVQEEGGEEEEWEEEDLLQARAEADRELRERDAQRQRALLARQQEVSGQNH